MGFAHLRRHASLWLARLHEFSRIALFLRRRALLRLMRANRRFACRLKWTLPIWASPTQESHAVWKNAGEKPACGFFCCYIQSILLFSYGDFPNIPISFLILGCGRATPAWSPTRRGILFLDSEEVIHFFRELPEVPLRSLSYRRRWRGTIRSMKHSL